MNGHKNVRILHTKTFFRVYFVRVYLKRSDVSDILDGFDISLIIVNRGKRLGNPANIKEAIRLEGP